MRRDDSAASSPKKGKHLSEEGRVIVSLRLKDRRSIRSDAGEIGRSPGAVSNEIKRRAARFDHGRAQEVWTLDGHVPLALLERKSRRLRMIPLANKGASAVIDAVADRRAQYFEHFIEMLKIITTERGSEFADLAQLESFAKTRSAMRILAPYAREDLRGAAMNSSGVSLLEGKHCG